MRIIACLLLLVSCWLQPTKADGVFEIDRIHLYVNGFKLRNQYQVRFCLHNSLFCEETVTANILNGKIMSPIVFDNHRGSWNNYHLQVSLSMLNGPIVAFAELKDNVFWRHKWTEAEMREPFYSITFRHRFHCAEGFRGLTCDQRVSKIISKAPTPTTTPPPVTVSTTALPATSTEAPEYSTTVIPTITQKSYDYDYRIYEEDPRPLYLLIVLLCGVIVLSITAIGMMIYIHVTREQPQKDVEKDRMSVNTVFSDIDSGYKVMSDMSSTKADIFVPPSSEYMEIV